MFKGKVLGIWYYSWNTYKEAYNTAVLNGQLFDKRGRKITTLLKG